MNQSLPPTAAFTHDEERVFAELLDRVGGLIEAGELAAAEAFIASHAQHADRLRRAVGAIEALAAFDSPDATESPGAKPRDSAASLVEQTLGDFRIVREIGRGGMGVVYEAIQISLGRRVALKVLPYAALLDARQRERFLNEARVAAGLHHTHIVPVYTVGSERGVYFYAMQYIAGRDLADVIAQIRKDMGKFGRGEAPTAVPGAATVRDEQALIETPRQQDAHDRFRQAAAWAANAAEALSYAHSVGVLHRDVKPANLLVDEAGAIWVSDFGLARLQTDPSLSAAGDLMGTLRYMSPEQARGDRTAVDARSDVYSLGVTLYELLALEPAVGATDQAALLTAVATRDPASLRRVDPRIPADLEAIVSKAIEKDARDRYQSAEALAADLRNFLAHRTITAQPPTLLERTRKWARRHKAIVQVAAVATIVVAIGALAATVLTLRAYRSEARQHAAADANLRVASDSIDRMLSRIADDRFFHGDLDHAETVAVDATDFYDQLLVHSDDPELRLRASHAQAKVADIWVLVGQHEQALQAYRRSIELVRPLIAALAAEPAYLDARAYAYQGVGESQWRLAKVYDALEPFQQAAADYQLLIDRFPAEPDYRQGLANAFNNMGLFALVTNRWDDAESYLDRATELAEHLPDEFNNSPTGLTNEAGRLGNRALLALSRKEFERAKILLAEAAAVQQRSLKIWPDNPMAVDILYKHYLALGETSLGAGRSEAAAQAVETLILAFPDRLDAYVDGATQLVSCGGLAEQAVWKGGGTDSGEYYQRAHELVERARELVAMAHEAPNRTSESVDRFAWFLLTCEVESLRDPTLALELATGVVEEVPERGGAWFTLALAHYRNGDWQAADEAIQRSIKLHSGGQGNAYDWLLLSMIRAQQGRNEEARQSHKKASVWIARNDPTDKDLLRLAAETDEFNSGSPSLQP